MEKIIKLLVLIIVLFSPKIRGQQNIILSFSSASKLDSVKIENQNNNNNTQVITGNSFEIVFIQPSNIESNKILEKSSCYPNPFSNKSIFDLSSDFSGTIYISVFDLSGSQIALLKQEVEAGSNRFIFKPHRPGIFFLNARYNSGSHTHKLVCIDANSDRPVIEYNGSVGSVSYPLSKLKASFDYESENFSANIGDLLRITGYSDTKLDTKYDFLYSDKNYEFNFQERYFEFSKYFIEESKPSFVDIIFSVSDTANKGIDYLTSENFIVTEDGKVNSANETYQNIRKNTEIPTLLKTILLLDNSSRVGSDLVTLKKSAKKFVQSMAENQEMAIFSYSDSAVLIRDFTSNKLILEYWIDKIKIDSGGSNLYRSLIKALNHSQDEYTPSYVIQGSMIVFTGGGDTEGDIPIEDVLLARGDKWVSTIMMNRDADSVSISKIANHGSYFLKQDIVKLNNAFLTIQEDIIRFSNSFYFMNYMSGKREGEHNVILTIKGNTGTSSASYLSGSYNAEGFSSVTHGVYLNPIDSIMYGFDTIRCHASRTEGYSFAYDLISGAQYNTSSLILQPVTYGGVNTPEYSLELDNMDVFKIESLPLTKAVLTPVNMTRDTVNITLRDIANNYSKTIVFIMEPPEFFENMGIVLSKIKDYRLEEISGIAASVKNPGHYWVHNDSGDDSNIFLIDTDGNTIVKVIIENITSRDWEDIAVGPGPVEGETYIYIAEIGDLDRKFKYKFLYRIEEPEIDTLILKQSLTKSRNEVAVFPFQYADGARDAEILMIDPDTKDLYVVTKRETNVQIYTLPYPQSESDTLVLVKSDVTLPFRLTNGGDISADGSEILLKNLTSVYYWKRKPGETVIGAMSRKAVSLPYVKEPQGEAIGWLRNGSGYITVSERKDNITPLLYLYKR